LMQAQDASTESGRKNIITLLNLQTESDAYYDNLEDIAKDFKEWNNNFTSVIDSQTRRRLTASGDTEGLREYDQQQEFVDLNASFGDPKNWTWLQTLQVGAANLGLAMTHLGEYAAETTLTLNKNRDDQLSLYAQYYALTNNMAGAQRVLNEQRRIELLTMDETTAGIQKAVWALEDAAKAAALLKEYTDTLGSIKERMLTARGDTQGLKKLGRDNEFADLDNMFGGPTNQTWFQKIQVGWSKYQLWMVHLAEDAAAVAAKSRDLNIRLIQAQGDDEAALFLQRQYEIEELRRVYGDASGPMESVLKSIWKLDDAAKALAASTAFFAQQRTLEARLLSAQAVAARNRGDITTAEDLEKKVRAANWDAEKRNIKISRFSGETQADWDKRLNDFSTTLFNIGWLEELNASFQDLGDTITDLVALNKDNIESLQSTIDSIMGGSSGVQSKAYFENRYSSLLSGANNDPTKIKDYASFATEYLDFMKDYGDPKAYEKVLGELITMQDRIETEVSISDAITGGKTISDLYDLLIKNGMGGPETSDAERIVMAAYKKYENRSGIGDDPSQIRLSGLNFWTNALESGALNLNNFDSTFRQAVYENSQRTPSFDNGGVISGPMSGYTLPTTFHGIEHITTDSDMKDIKKLLQNLVATGKSGDNVVVKVSIGNKELKEITAEIVRTDPETQTQIRRVANV